MIWYRRMWILNWGGNVRLDVHSRMYADRGNGLVNEAHMDGRWITGCVEAIALDDVK